MTTLIPADNSWLLFAILTVIAAGALWLEQKYKWAAKMSGCVICLIAAMALANLRIIPTDAAAYDFVWGYIVPLAIPGPAVGTTMRQKMAVSDMPRVLPA